MASIALLTASLASSRGLNVLWRQRVGGFVERQRGIIESGRGLLELTFVLYGGTYRTEGWG
jgi:hypothetical protein